MTPLGTGASWGQDLVLCPRPRGPLTQPPSSRHPHSCSAFPRAGVSLAGPLHTPTAHWASPPPAPADRAAPIRRQPGEVVAVQSVPGLCGTRGRPPADPMPAQGARAAPRHPGLRGRTPASQPQVWAGPLLLLPPGDVRLAPRTGRHARPHGPSRHAHWGRPQCPSRLRTRVRAPDGGSELSPRPGVGRGAGSPAATCSGRGSGASQAGPHLGESPPADGGAPGPQGREEGRLASSWPPEPPGRSAQPGGRCEDKACGAHDGGGESSSLAPRPRRPPHQTALLSQGEAGPPGDQGREGPVGVPGDPVGSRAAGSGGAGGRCGLQPRSSAGWLLSGTGCGVGDHGVWGPEPAGVVGCRW